MPASIALESEGFLPGWRSVTNLGGRGLGRKIENAKWNYFYLADAMKVTVLARESRATLRRAVRRVLAKKQSQRFNALEITKIISTHLLGVPYLTISARSRHIQEGVYLAHPGFSAEGQFDLATTPIATIVFGGVEKVRQE